MCVYLVLLVDYSIHRTCVLHLCSCFRFYIERFCVERPLTPQPGSFVAVPRRRQLMFCEFLLTCIVRVGGGVWEAI